MNAPIASIKSRLDAVVVILVFLQIAYCYWEPFISFRGVYPWRVILPAIATYSIIIFALPGYMRGQKWAWAMIFLFSLYILHQTFILRLYWHGGIEHSFAIAEIVASALCMRILSSTAKDHSIGWWEFSKVLSAIAIAEAVIFVRGNYFPSDSTMFTTTVSQWVFIESMSQITAWRMLLLFWCCYAGICLIIWIAARYILTRSTQAHL
jgi:hypothetical protein